MARFRSELAILLSFVLTFAVIMNAFYHKKQFYPSIVYLTKSNSSMAILYLQAFVIALLVGKVMNKIFFGQLRPIEIEHLFERSWYAITETCLAFTVFRDDFSPEFVTMFTLLLFLKCFHWLAEDRVEFMERSPSITFLFHLRIVGLIGLLMLLDLSFVHIAYGHTITKGASVQLVFGFEYAILFFNVLSTFIKYLLHTIDLQSENPWENRGIYMLYSDLLLGFIRVVLYLTFMSLMIKIHTFPLFAIRPMYLSLRSFKKSLSDVIMSRRAINNLNTMYPDVTAEQLRNYADTICIICREEMSNGDANDNNVQQIKKLPCDHIFHKNCLRSWFQRQQTCPTCRTPIFRNNPQQSQQQQQQQQQPRAAPPTPAAAQAPNQAQQPAAADHIHHHHHVHEHAAAAGAEQPGTSANLNQTQTPLGRSSFFAFQPNEFSAHPAFLGMPPPPPPLGGSFPLPPFAFLPPPLPPLDLPPSLSMEELAELEGNERHNVEARIHCLRNLSILLNASMVHMQQYMNICSATSHLENLTQSKRSKIENDLNLVNKMSNSKLTTLNPNDNDATTSKTQPTTSSAAAAEATTDSTSTAASAATDKEEEDPTKSPTLTPNGSSSDLIRRKRLEHLETNS